MRCLKVLSVVVPSFILGGVVAAGCASDEGEKIFFVADAAGDGHGHADVTTHAEGGFRDTGMAMGIDSFVAPPEGGDDDSGDDAGDGGESESGVDSGLLFYGNPGTACTTLGAVQGQACGRCGMQTSVCIVRPDGGVPFDAGVDSGVDAGVDAGHHLDGSPDGAAHDGEAHDGAAHDGGAQESGAHDGEAHESGAHDGEAHDAADHTDAEAHDATADASHDDADVPNEAGPKDAGKDAKAAVPAFVWSEWSSCTGEIDGGCLPGTQTTQSCGICGTQTVVCEPDCELGATNCVGQMASGCIPGTVEFTVVAACATDGGIGGKTESCGPTCQVDASATCEAPPSTLVISPNAAGKVNTFVNFIAATADEKPLVGAGQLPADCPMTPLTTTDLTPAGFVTLKNPSSTQMAMVSVWASQAPTRYRSIRRSPRTRRCRRTTMGCGAA